MASLANDGGLFRVLVSSPTRNRYPIRLGRVKRRYAQTFCTWVTELEDAVNLNQPPREAVGKWLSGLRNDVRLKLVKAGLATSDSAANLSEWFEKHLASKTRIKIRSRVKLEQTRRSLIAYFKGGRHVGSITVDEALDWKTSLEVQRLSEATVKTHCGNAKEFFNAAVRRGLIAKNPFGQLPSGSTRRSVMTHVSPADIEAVIQHLPNARFKLLLGLSGFGGLRIPSESRLVRRCDVNPGLTRLRVHCAKTDGHPDKMVRYVPICPRLRPLVAARIQELEGEEDYLCPIGTEAGIGGHARRVVLRAIVAAGQKPWPDIFQTLRSSLVLELKTSGLPEFAVDAWLGHNNATSRRHYTSGVPEQLFDRVSGPMQAAQNPAQKTSETRGMLKTEAEEKKARAAESPVLSEDFQELPLQSEIRKMEAEGIEPSSQDNVSVGLYMLSRFFNLDADDENRHPSPASSRLYLTLRQRPSCKASLLFSARASQTSTLCRDHLLLGSHCENRSVETNAAGHITVIGS